MYFEKLCPPSPTKGGGKNKDRWRIDYDNPVSIEQAIASIEKTKNKALERIRKEGY